MARDESRNRGASLLTLCYVLHLFLKAVVLGAQHPEAGGSGMGIGQHQTAESETIEVLCSKCQPHFLEDWQTLMQLGIRSAVHRTSPPSSGYTISFSTSRDIRQRLNCSNQLGTYIKLKGITMSKGEVIQCCKELQCIGITIYEYAHSRGHRGMSEVLDSIRQVN